MYLYLCPTLRIWKLSKFIFIFLFRISNMSYTKMYSDCFKSPCLATAGRRCAKLYGLDLIAGRRIPTDGNCMLTFASDQLVMRYLICIM